jgi:hypothetical protein
MKLACIVVVSLVACVSPSQPDLEVAAKITCDDWMCGMNSPLIESFGLHELNLDGLPNAQGFAISSVTRGFGTYSLAVVNGHIIGTRIAGPLFTLPQISGQNLVNTMIRVTHEGSALYVIRIGEVDSNVDPWASTGAMPAPHLESYLLEWSPTSDGQPINEWLNLCSQPPAVDPYDDALGMNQFHTLVFEGERIDAPTKTISSTLDKRWVNFGCAGSTLAKLYLTGHVQAAKVAGFTTTLDERRTMLKLLSADYCGNGTPFTVAGQPLWWKDDHGWMDYGERSHLEARWTPRGAACLETPRVAYNHTTLGDDTFPDIEQAITAVCRRPPTCGDADPEHLAGYHLASGNPVP